MTHGEGPNFLDVVTVGEHRSTTRVLIVDDAPMVRFGLGMILRGAPELEVVGEAGDGA